MVSTLDFESSDPSSNLGGTFTFSIFSLNDIALHDNNFLGSLKVTVSITVRKNKETFHRFLSL